jgi:hypothetical protein
LGFTWSRSRHALQVAVAVASTVPIAAGAAGVMVGPAMLGELGAAAPDLSGHFRYLSGVLLGIGLAYASAVPRIERQQERYLLLGTIVVIGGIGRLLAVLLAREASPTMVFALIMELLVTPALTLWQRRIAR